MRGLKEDVCVCDGKEGVCVCEGKEGVCVCEGIGREGKLWGAHVYDHTK